jgi:AAA family ATP:ADP antiporter
MAPPPVIRGVRRSLLRFFAFEPGESRPALLLTLYLLLAIASVIALKAISNSLFLKRFSAEGLPYVYVAIAATAGFVVSLYIRLSARLPQNRLLIFSQSFFSVNLILFWLLLRMKLDWLPAVIYVWTGVYAVIIPSQVWTLANHIFTTRQARRLFSVVGTGGILGAALGGQLSGVMVRALGTENLLLAGIGFLTGCSAIVAYLWHTARAQSSSGIGKSRQSAPASLSESLAAIRESSHLRWMTTLVVLSAVVNGLVDYQFKYIVRQEFGADSDGMTVFFATFHSYLAVFGLAMQLILTSRIMRWFGLNFAVFVLPLSMLAGSSVLLVSAGLLAGILIKGFDQGFRHSIDRSSTELLYVPLPSRLKQQAKSFIDMVASRSADALAGLLLLVLVKLLAFNVQQISWVNIALIVPWIGAAWLLRREYVNALRVSIERKDISAEALLVEMAGSSSEEITTVLSSTDERAVETGLGLLQYGASSAAHANLAALLTHLSPTIRRKAMAIVAAKNVPGCGDQVMRFLYLDDQVSSLWLALDYLERQNGDRFHETLHELLKGPYPVLRGAAAARLLDSGDPHYQAEALQTFNKFLEAARAGTSEDRERAAELLGRVPPELECQSCLVDLLADAEPTVVRAAAISAGRARQRRLLPRLIELAADRSFRTEARQALAAFGPQILPQLNQALLSSTLPLAVRRNLPRVFSAIGGQEAADYLTAALDHPDLALQYQTVRALSRIRLRQADVRFHPERINPHVLQELGRYYRYRSALEGVPQNGPHPGGRFLRRALSEQLHRRLDVIFRLIGLLYPPKDIHDAYYGISSGRRDLQANAVEFLDSTLLNPVRQMLLLIIEDRGAERIIEQGKAWFGIRPGGYLETIRTLLHEPDPWLQACAAYAAAEQGLREILPLLDPLDGSADDLLRETVNAARQRLAAAPASAASGVLWRH